VRSSGETDDASPTPSGGRATCAKTKSAAPQPARIMRNKHSTTRIRHCSECTHITESTHAERRQGNRWKQDNLVSAQNYHHYTTTMCPNAFFSDF